MNCVGATRGTHTGRTTQQPATHGATLPSALTRIAGVGDRRPEWSRTWWKGCARLRRNRCQAAPLATLAAAAGPRCADLVKSVSCQEWRTLIGLCLFEYFNSTTCTSSTSL